MPAAPSCPQCQRVLDASCWTDDTHGACPRCRRPFGFFAFPAFRARRQTVRPRAVAGSGEASCFFHAQNRADLECEGCGRFLCSLCSVDFLGRILCPPCIAARQDTDAKAVKERVLYGNIALTLAVLPLLLWPVSLLTAPAALGAVVVGWNKPRSLVRPGRWRLWLAGVIAVIEIGAWLFLGIKLLIA